MAIAGVVDHHLSATLPGPVIMRPLVGTKLSLIAWFLGANHRFNSDDHAQASMAIYVVAGFKRRLGLQLHGAAGGAPAAAGVVRGYCIVLERDL